MKIDPVCNIGFSDIILNLYMDEIIFLVEESPEGGYTAKGMGVSIFTEAESHDALKESVKDAIHCHYDDDKPFSFC